MRYLLVAALAVLLPASVLAAPPATSTSAVAYAGRSLVLATSSPGNAYLGGASVIVVSPVKGDLSALGGTLTVAAPVLGDALLFGGSTAISAPVTGDLRIFAGTITIDKPVAGDLFALGFSLKESAHVQGSVLVAAANASVTGGADGPVTIYGNSVTLGGEFAGTVGVVAADHLTLLPDTTIHGSLTYQSPLPASIPDSAHVVGETTYTQASYLPGANISRALAIASIGIFLVVRILALLILAGLLTGLFPRLADAVIDEGYERSIRHMLLTTLLGFAAFVATPILILFLALTFIGLALAVLLFIAYALLVFLALMYAGITLGGVASRRFFERDGVLWRDGVLGTLALSLIALVPVVGLLIVLVLASFAAGALLQIFFRFAFTREEEGEMI